MCKFNYYRVFSGAWHHGSHIGVQNNETLVAMLVSQANHVGVEFFSYVNTFCCVPINSHVCWLREWKWER